MPFNYRDKPNLVDRLRGKLGDDILNELKSGLDNQGRRMFFDSPSWRSRHSNSAFPRGFPFDDDRNRTNIRTYLDEIASRHPEFADQLKESSWGEDLVDPSFARTGSSGVESNTKNADGEASGSKQSQVQEPRHSLSNFGLRNTVPLGSQTCSEQDRHQRSMSAPPENSGSNKRFVTKCEIPVMNNPVQDSVPVKPDLAGKGPQEPNIQKANNAPNVRVIPIQVEGRDTPLVNTNLDTATNFGVETFAEPSFEGRLPRDFGSYQRHSPRFARKDRAPTPPQYQYAPQYQQYVPPSQHFMSQQHFVPPEQQAFAHQQQRPQKPSAPPPPHPQQQPPPQQQKPPPQQQPPQHPQQQQQQQPQGPKFPPQGEESESKPPQQKVEPIKDPIVKVQAIQKEVDELMKEVEAFKGTSRTDKQYLLLDELLTRQLLLLDNIDTEGKDNVRQARKDTIRSIQRCISTLESKVPLTENSENTTESLAIEEEQKAVQPSATEPMEMDIPKESTPVGGTESQNMEVDAAACGSVQEEQHQEPHEQEKNPDQTKEENKEKI